MTVAETLKVTCATRKLCDEMTRRASKGLTAHGGGYRMQSGAAV